MPQIIVLKPFKFAHRGVEVEEFEPSTEPQEVAQEVVDHAGLVEEGYIEVVGAEPLEPAAPVPAAVEQQPAPARKTTTKKA